MIQFYKDYNDLTALSDLKQGECFIFREEGLEGDVYIVSKDKWTEEQDDKYKRLIVNLKTGEAKIAEAMERWIIPVTLKSDISFKNGRLLRN